MSPPATPQSASALIATASETDNHLELLVGESWLQGRSWFGGVQLALALRAVRRFVDADTPVRSVHMTFVAPILHTEPAVASATLLRAGRSVTHVKAQVSQGDRICFQCTAILGAGRESTASYARKSPSNADPDAASRFPHQPGVTPNLIQNYDMRWVRGAPPFTAAKDPNSTIYARPAAEHASYDESEILAIVDVIPPPVLSLLSQPAPASSMNCALELVRPELVYGTRQWLRFEVTLHDAHSGYAWQSALIYAENGVLVAIAHQSVAVFG